MGTCKCIETRKWHMPSLRFLSLNSTSAPKAKANSFSHKTATEGFVAHVGDSPSVRDRSLVTRALRTRLRVPLLGNGLELRFPEHTGALLGVSGVRRGLVFLTPIRSRVVVRNPQACAPCAQSPPRCPSGPRGDSSDQSWQTIGGFQGCAIKSHTPTIYPAQESNQEGRTGGLRDALAYRPYGHAPRPRLGAPRRLWRPSLGDDHRVLRLEHREL